MKVFSIRSAMLTLLIALLLPAALVQAAPVTPTGAKTTPPPADFSVLTVFDPDFTYLERGQGYISDAGKGKVNIWGETFGTVRTDEIGVQLTLQRWTGTAWIDVYYGGSETENNAAYAYSSINVSVESGYYYRTKAYHWIEEGSVIESGYRFSSSYLAS